ncbi:MAG: O-antigen ligase family protein [bacterium]|nr:O-antigen ligase family protein [bacterium]
MVLRLDAQRLFFVVWRAAIVLLPWQMRYFLEGPLVNGYPWEQGRVSVYAYSIVMVATVLLALWIKRGQHKDVFNAKRFGWLFGGGVLLILVSLFTVSLRASLLFWSQIILLSAFFWALYAMRVSVVSVMRWFVVSLIPHAAFGIVQFFSQSVFASKWLGMSAQLPATSGVSVIETAGRRVLRAYGGLPHPNILGGWLAVGFLSGLRLAWREADKRLQGFLLFAITLFATALFFTFSRSAWVAVLFGLIFLFARRPESLGPPCRRSPWFIVPFLVPVALMIIYWPLLYERTAGWTDTSSRLEQLSATERTASLETGMITFKNNWIVGTGPGTSALVQAMGTDRAGPPVPPHMTWLMIVSEVGIAGWFALIFLLVFLKRHRLTHLGAAIGVALLVLASFDHYLWSYWSGLSLLFLAGFVLFFDRLAILTAEP